MKFIKVYAELNPYDNSIKLRAPANKISKSTFYVSVHNTYVMEKLCVEIGILMEIVVLITLSFFHFLRLCFYTYFKIPQKTP